MQDLLPIFPSCFYPSAAAAGDPSAASATAKLGQTLTLSSYKTLISDVPHLITITWSKNLLFLSLQISIQNPNPKNNIAAADPSAASFKIELRPWHFRRRHGSKSLSLDSHQQVDVFWDLRSAKFSDEPEPLSDYYVAVVSDREVILLVGDLKLNAFRRIGFGPSMAESVLVCKKDHVFGKRRFGTRVRLDERSKLWNEIVVEIAGDGGGDGDWGMVMRVDGEVGVEVKHLQWKFRGHELVVVGGGGVRVEVYWDVHDWLFGECGFRHGVFIFKPVIGDGDGGGESDFCLFLYAWRLE